MLEINNNEVNAVIDTGASMSAISKNQAESCNVVIERLKNIKLIMAGNQTVYASGFVKAMPISINGKMFTCEACVLKDPAHNLLHGYNLLSKYNVILT